MNATRHRVCVIGLGHVGLPTAALLASLDHEVIGVDLKAEHVDTINAGKVTSEEPGLAELVNQSVASGRLRATTKPEPADVFLIAVPTPLKGDHEADLIYVQSAMDSIAAVLSFGSLVIIESTCPVGTTETLSKDLATQRPDLCFPNSLDKISDIAIAYCPERILPGRSLEELQHNDRIVGGMSPNCTERAVKFFEPCTEGKLVATDSRTAEMVKLVENAYRDVNIAFANELSLLCEQFEMDVWEVIELANRHPRVDILRPSAGVGGHCLPIDPWFLISAAPEQSRLMRAARHINTNKTRHVVEAILSAQKLTGGKVAILGLTYKPDVDDARGSPGIHIVESLLENGVEVMCYDPVLRNLPATIVSHPNAKRVELDEALTAAEVIAILIDHKDLQRIDLNDLGGKTVLNIAGHGK